jgi:MoaA/NifB/PqqE/SkfB family radical SAM enzyme
MGHYLLRAGLDLLVFSIDECEPGLYGDIRQGLSFHKVLDNVQRFVDMRDGGGYKTEVRVRICLMEENRKRIVKIEQFWKNIVDTVGAMPELDVLSKGEVDAHPFFFNQQPLKCSDPYRSFVVRPDGKVVLCCTDWYDNFMIAKVDMNVTERDVLEIFNSDAMNYLRDGMKTGERIPSVCMFCKGRTGK